MTNITIIRNQMPAVSLASNELYQKYLDYIDVRPATAEAYRRNLKQLFDYFFLNGIRQPERKDIIGYRDYLKDEKGLKATSIQAYMNTVRQFFKWTEQESLYPNIATNIRSPKVSSEHKRGYMTAEQIRDVLDTADSDSIADLRDRAMMALMAGCGLRTIEVVRLDVSDIKVMGTQVYIYVQGKGMDDKTGVILPLKVQTVISKYLKARKAKESEPLFTSVAYNHKGERMTTRSIRRIVKDHMKTAGIDTPFITAHSFRHSCVTLSLLAGEDLLDVKEAVRHSKVDTTMHYNHMLKMERNTCTRTVADMIL